MPPRASPYRVVVLADDPLVRHGLHALVAQAGSLQLAAEAGDAALWDLGADPRAALASAPPRDPPLVALLDDERLVGDVLAAGARAVLPREATPEKLAAAVAAAVEGLVAIDEAFASTLVPVRRGDAASEELTAREREVLQLLAEGLSNKGIAQRLDISDHTAKFHVNAILSKLGAQSRTDAVVKAARLGLLLL